MVLLCAAECEGAPVSSESDKISVYASSVYAKHETGTAAGFDWQQNMYGKYRLHCQIP